MLHKKRAGGCSSPSSSPWARRWRITNVCDSWPVRRQTYGYFPSHKVSPPIGWYQIILLGDIGTCVLTTCPGLHSTVGAGIQSWENKNNNQYIIDRCYVHVRTVFGHVTELCSVQTYWSLAAGRPACLALGWWKQYSWSTGYSQWPTLIQSLNARGRLHDLHCTKLSEVDWCSPSTALCHLVMSGLC